ncbi:MAG: ribosome-recycling factor [Minisyncoccales bacterium]
MSEEKKKLNYKELIEELKSKIEKEIDFFDNEIKKLRTQRINPELIENLPVEMFGQKFVIKQLGMVSILGPHELFLNLWDQSYLEPTLEALQRSDLGASFLAQERGIKISFPPLSEEFKKSLLKIISQKKENLRKKIRNLKEKVWNRISEAEREKALSQEEKFRAKKEIQDVLEKFQEKIESLIERKEKEILE